MKPRQHSLITGLCVVFLGAWAPLGAQAQVIRCTDAATGKVTYTDGKCASGATEREVEARKTPQEIQQEREEAAEALARKQQRLQAEATAAEAESRRNAPRPRGPGEDDRLCALPGVRSLSAEPGCGAEQRHGWRL
mgnify:CR=1 FL=1